MSVKRQVHSTKIPLPELMEQRYLYRSNIQNNNIFSQQKKIMTLKLLNYSINFNVTEFLLIDSQIDNKNALNIIKTGKPNRTEIRRKTINHSASNLPL